MHITVECHGLLREICGAELALEIPQDDATVAAALQALAAQHPALNPHLPRVACARGDTLVARDAPLAEGDRLALIPPVSGGCGGYSRGTLGRRWRATVAAFAALAIALAAVPAHAGEVLVFAAASLTDALGEAGRVYEKQSSDEINFSFASSSTLARQIANGAQADIYASANIKWMDYLQERGQILTATRVKLLANRLVLIAPVGSEIDSVEVRDGFPIADMLGDSYLAMGNPAHVPAGIYGKQALKSLGVWPAVEGKIARAANVRAALALVATGEAPLGIVYRTDALAEDDVKIVATFPQASHAPVVYPVAMTPASKGEEGARAFFDYLQSEEADRIFKQYGFMPLD